VSAVSKLSIVADRDRKLDALATSPMARKAFDDLAAQTLKQRKDLVAELKALDETAERELPKLRAEIDAGHAEFIDARKSFYSSSYDLISRAPAASAGILAQAKIASAQNKSVIASFTYDASRNRIEHELRRTASPAIALFVGEMRDAWHKTKNTTVQIQARPILNFVTGKISEAIATNAASLAVRMRAIRSAIATAENLALEADQSDIDLRLEKLRQALPAVGAAVVPTKEN
jgi:hypothetical protein